VLKRTRRENLQTDRAVLPAAVWVGGFRRFTWLLFAAAPTLATGAGAGDYATETRLNATVRYGEIPREYAQAIARTVSAARGACADDAGFDVPGEIQVTVDVDPCRPVLLYGDGRENLFLRVPSPRQLRRPLLGGADCIYALCREMARMALFRLIGDPEWMSAVAADGWSHYFGSVLVDKVYEAEGARLWPDEYNYLAGGTRRLESQLAQPIQPLVVQAAGLWRDLAGMLPRRGLADLFRSIAKTQADPNDPGQSVLKVLKRKVEDTQGLSEWWDRARPVFVSPSPLPGGPPETIEPRSLAGSPLTLQHDTGSSSGLEAPTASGHAVRFEAPAGTWYLTGVRIYGSALGSLLGSQPAATVWLLNGKTKLIAEYKGQYSFLRATEPQWVGIPVLPTRVPRSFIVCLRFRPTRSGSVALHMDRNAEGHSFTGLPGQTWEALNGAEWMFRVDLDRAKEADSLADPRQWPLSTQPSSATPRPPPQK
jgi:hypothetical protein